MASASSASASIDSVVRSLDEDLEEASIRITLGSGKSHSLTATQASNSILLSVSFGGDAGTFIGGPALSALISKKPMDEREVIIPSSSISEYAFEKIMAYLEHHNGVAIRERPLPVPARATLADYWEDEWDVAFIEKIYADGPEADKCKYIYEVEMAANYLEIKSLIYLCSAKLVMIIRSVPLAKVRAALGVVKAKASASAPASAPASAGDSSSSS
jgi:hypothetical protein